MAMRNMIISDYAWYTLCTHHLRITPDTHSLRSGYANLARGEGSEPVPPPKERKNDHRMMVVFLCQEATKKIFFAFCIKVSNSHGLLYQRLSHLQSSSEYHSDLFFGFDDHALDYLSNDLVIVFHRVVLESVENGVNFVES